MTYRRRPTTTAKLNTSPTRNAASRSVSPRVAATNPTTSCRNDVPVDRRHDERVSAGLLVEATDDGLVLQSQWLVIEVGREDAPQHFGRQDQLEVGAQERGSHANQRETEDRNSSPYR